VSGPDDALPPEPLRAYVASAWVFRWGVEREAAARFARFAAELERFGAPAHLVELCRASSLDEERHAAHCARLSSRFGQPALVSGPVVLEEIAPSGLSSRQRLLYEVVAASCVTETVSVAVLTSLVRTEGPAQLQSILRELLRDEVKHSQLGWAYLSHERAQLDVRFLSELVPYMLGGAESADLFQDAEPLEESPELVPLGVLPRSSKRRLFAETLRQVVFPGLEQMGVDPRPSEAWLDAALRGSTLLAACR